MFTKTDFFFRSESKQNCSKSQHLSICATFTVIVALVLVSFVQIALASDQVPQTPLSGKSISKYVDPLPTFIGVRVQAGTGYTVSMEEFTQQVLPASYPKTTVWGYKVGNAPASYPGFTVEAQKGTAVSVTYINNLIGPSGGPPLLQKYLTLDQTLNWADPYGLMCEFNPANPACFQPFAGPVPAVAHLHGAEVPSAFDGGPQSWFTPGLVIKGSGFVSNVYRYPNTQEATTLWFHDHAFGATRLNVYAGLAAFYFLRDDRDTGQVNNPIGLPAGNQEVEVAIQDRLFDTNGQWLFPDGFPCGPNGCPPNPTVHPFWIPEFFGDVIVVNGKTWPYLNVEPRRYRFRLLDGSNARMYNLTLMNLKSGQPGPAIWQIGTDGGLLDNPVPIAFPDRLFMAPGERADVIVDFSGFAGQTLILVNSAKAPFPSGAPADPQTVGQIMQFRVANKVVRDTTCNPAAGSCNLRGNNPIVRLADPTKGTVAPGITISVKRELVLREIEGPGGPREVLLNNTEFSGLQESTLATNPTPIACLDGTTDCLKHLGSAWFSELPTVGSTEEWDIINTTADAHPIHVHLVQFQLINRQPFKSTYVRDWETALRAAGLGPGDGPPFPYDTVNGDGAVGGNLAVGSYLHNVFSPPSPNEAGWKDTVVMRPGEVTRIAVRWAPQDVPINNVAPGQIAYPFDPTSTIGQTDFSGNPGGPGYVWHCHIIDHEDNEMMRPYIPVCPSGGCVIQP